MAAPGPIAALHHKRMPAKRRSFARRGKLELPTATEAAQGRCLMRSKASIPSLSRGVAILLCYSFAALFLGMSLAWATLFALYPHSGPPLRPLIFAGFFAFVVTLGWTFVPLNRPNLGAISLRVVMVWSLIAAAGILRVHLHGGALRPDELIVLSTSASIFLAGIYFSRYTRWGRKHFVRRQRT